VIFFACEEVMPVRKQFQRPLPPAFLVFAVQTMRLFPGARLNDSHRDSAAGDHRLKRADRAAILEAAA
jgi:hypothetical protein